MKGLNLKKTGASVILILLIMGISVAFRLAAGTAVVRTLGEAAVDPGTGLPYLTEMDSYYHLRMTEDLRQYGHPGEALKDGKAWDTLSYAPEGRSAAEYSPLMAYIAIGIHRILSVFGGISLQQTAYWLGAFLSALVVVPVFILSEGMQGKLAAAAASVLAALNYGYFVHTVPGFYDTDTVISWTGCLMLCAACLLISAFSGDGKKGNAGKKAGTGSGSGKKAGTGNGSGRKGRPESAGSEKPPSFSLKQAGAAAFFAISFFLLALSWNVYSLFLGILTAALLLYAALTIWKGRKSGQNCSLKSALPAVLFLVLIFAGAELLTPGFFGNILSTAGSVFKGGGSGLFPDAYISVSEMRRPVLIAGGISGLFQMKVLSGSNIGILNAVGGIVPTAAAIVMWGMLLRRTIRGEIRFENLLLLVWFPVTAVLAFRSWRFIMLFAVPTALLAGLFTGWLAGLMREKKMMDWQVFAGMLTILMVFPAIYGSFRSSADSLPQVNRALDQSMDAIREISPENTILAGWWDYGYFFEEKTRRRTIFDGGSQNGERIYWTGKALSTDNGTLSRNIFRMLSGSGDKATEQMLSAFGEERETLDFMVRLLSADRTEALKSLKEKGIGEDRAEELASCLFPSSEDPVLCVITPDMPSISQWFARFGSWGEEGGSDGADYVILMDRGRYEPRDGTAAWAFAAGREAVSLFLEEEEEGYRAYTSWSGAEESTQPCPVEKVIKKENGRITEYFIEAKGNSKETPGWTVLLDMDGPAPQVSLTTSRLMNSVFGQLFYLDGSGMEQFRPAEGTRGSASLYWVE